MEELVNLKAFISENNINVSKLAKQVKCSKSYLWYIVNGKRKLTYEMAVEIANALHTKPDKLFYQDFHK